MYAFATGLGMNYMKSMPIRNSIVITTGKGALCGLLLLAVIFSNISMARAEDAKPDASWSVTPLLPPETLMVVSVRDVKKTSARFQQTGIWQIISNADVLKAFSAPMMQAKFGMAAAEISLKVKFSDLASYFTQGEITLAVLGVDKKNAQGQPVPDVLLSVQALDKAQVLLEEISKRVDELKAATGGQLQISQVQAGNVTVNQLTLPTPDMPLTFAYAICDGNILVSFGEGRIEKILAVREKAKAAPPAADGPVTMLAQVPSFKKALEKTGADSDVLAYFNIEALLKNQNLNIQPKTEREKAGFEASGLDKIRAISYCSAVKGKGIREAFFMDIPADARKGLLSLVESDGLDPEALAAAPRNSLIAMAFKVSPEKIYDVAGELATIENPNAKQEINAMLLGLGQQLGIDLKKEVLGALSGQAVFSVSMTAHNPKLAVGFPEPLLVIGIKDTAALKNTLKAVRNAVQENLLFTELTDGDKEIVTARERFPQGRDAMQLSYMIDKNDLVVSLYPLALREELRRRAALTAEGKKPGASLADDPDFAAARANLSPKPQALAYIDTGALAVAAYDVLIPVAQLQPRQPQVDVTALPTSDVIMQNLGGAVFDFAADADGMMAEGYSPTGAISFLGVAIPAAMRARQFAGRNAQNDMNRRQNVIDKVGQALSAYVKANDGKYPATLQEIAPKYLENLGADKLDAIVYRGKQDAENKVVAHSSEKIRGPITALLQNGSVVQVKRDQLGKVLLQGYTEQAQAAPVDNGNGNGAVKPPRPPEF